MHVHSPGELLLPSIEPSDLNDDAAMWIMMCDRVAMSDQAA
jgi:hypothetical protein